MYISDNKFRGTLFQDDYFPTVWRNKFREIEMEDLERFEDWLKQFTIKRYMDGQFPLISPSKFRRTESGELCRNSDTLFTNGVWLEIDGDNISPEIFAEVVLPRLRMTIYGSNVKHRWLPENTPPYTVYIPTTYVLTQDTHSTIVSGIRRRLGKTRRQLEIKKGKRMRSRLRIENLFWLPRKGQHFKTYRDDDRFVVPPDMFPEYLKKAIACERQGLEDAMGDV